MTHAACQKARVSLRSAFQMLASDMAEQTGSACSKYLTSTYDAAVDFVDRKAGDLIAERSGSPRCWTALPD